MMVHNHSGYGDVYGINIFIVIFLCMLPGIIYFLIFQFYLRKKYKEKYARELLENKHKQMLD